MSYVGGLRVLHVPGISRSSACFEITKWVEDAMGIGLVLVLGVAVSMSDDDGE